MTGQMTSKPMCPCCGAEVPPDAPRGYCLKCLFALGAADLAFPAVAPTDQSEIGSRPFGDYELLEEVARGGMGIVFKARQKSLDRTVAVKMLLFGEKSGKEHAQRFRTESALAASLQHPNIVAIHEVSAHEGQPFFVMDYVEGQSLAKLNAEWGVRNAEWLRRSARYVKTVAEAIHYAHERGILHRDLKPSNVLIDLSDQPRVTDFGLARRLPDSPSSTANLELTLSGQVLGSPNYMPPEQAAARRGLVGRRSDVYSLGAILYHLLTGRPPFVGETLTDTLHSVLSEEPISPRLLNPSVRPDLETLCLKCLEKDPARRYSTALALAEELDRFLRDEPIQARPVGSAERLWRWSQRKPALAAAFLSIALLLLVVIIGSAVAAWRIAQARNLAEVRLYAADMNAAQHALESGNLGRARDFLNAHWPKPGEPDLRGFEWRYLWNLCRGENFLTFSGHSNVVWCVAFSPDGKTLASGGSDSSVKLWDVPGRRLLATLPPHADSVTWLGFSRDGQTLVTASDDGLIGLWNVKTRQLAFTIEEKAACVALSPVGSLLAIGHGHTIFGNVARGPIKLWDYATHQLVKTLPGPGSHVAFSPDGKILAARIDNDAVTLWNVETGEVRRELNKTGEVRCLGFSPDGQTLVTGNWAGDVQGWDAVTGERGLPFKGHREEVWSLAFSPDGQTLATGGCDQTLRLWNVATGQEVAKFKGHGSEVTAVAFAPDGQTLATGGKDSLVMLWSMTPRRTEVVLTNVQFAPTFSPDSKLLTTSRVGGPVTVWDVAARQPVWVLNGEEFAQFTAEGTTLATISTNRVLRSWDAATRTLKRSAPLPGVTDPTQNLRFAMRGNRLATIDRHGAVTLHDAATGRWIEEIKAGAGTVNRDLDNLPLRFSQDGRLLAMSDGGQQILLWDVASQKVRAVMAHKSTTPGLAFSADGALLASASYDDTVGFLRVLTGKEEAPLTSIKSGCSGVAFSGDGRTLAVACEDGTVRLWNMATRREVAVLKHGQAPLRFVEFSPNGQRLVSVCEDGTLRFWDGPSPDGPNHDN